MENAIQVFDFQSNQVRVIAKNGDLWLVAKDVCEILELSNVTMALEGLEEDERAKYYLGRQGETNIINEAGLYSLILRSRKPEAKSFKRWITHEVIPSIRRHGGYLTPAKLEEVLLHPDTLIKLAQNLKDEQTKRAALEAKVAEDAPKVLFADSVAASNKDILVGELAKIICQNGYDIGEKRLYQWLRDNGYLIKDGRSDRNRPMQRYLEMGLFRVSETVISIPDKAPITKFTTRVTPKGVQYFINKFLNGGLKVA